MAVAIGIESTDSGVHQAELTMGSGNSRQEVNIGDQTQQT